jgi:hypothetical protein
MNGRTLLPDYLPPGGRETPRRLNELLREIDPTAELIYAGRGRWVLGSVRPNRITREKAERMIETIQALMLVAGSGKVSVPAKVKQTLAFRLWRYRLWRDGFRPISTYTVGSGEPGSAIVEEFRMRDHLFRLDFDAQLREREEEADMDAQDMKRVEALRDYLQLMYKDLHSTIIRNRKSVVVNGTRDSRRLA